MTPQPHDNPMVPKFGDQTAVRRLADGSWWCPIKYVYGVPVSTSSEHFRNLCEARFILSLPGQEARRAYMAKAATRRGSGDEEVAQIRAALEAAVMREWNWRKSPERQEAEAA